MPTLSRIGAAAAVVLALLNPVAPAQTASDASPDAAQEAFELERRAIAEFNSGDHRSAATLLERQRELTPKSFIVHYNLACARAQLGDLDEAEDRVMRAIELGFDDVHKFRLDPALEPIRERQVYSDMLDNWPAFLDARRNGLLKRDRAWTRGLYVERSDPAMRIEIISAHGDGPTDLALTDLQRVAVFAHEIVFTELNDEPWLSHLPWVVVVLPSDRDFKAWAEHAVAGVGHGFAAVGGAYDHDAKRLVAQDLGATLWHEFVHVLHYRDMSRLDRVHPVWLDEGLGALVEAWEPEGESLRPVPGWRINQLKRLQDRSRLPTIESLLEMDRSTFTDSRALAHYAHARAVMLFLHDRSALNATYRAMTETFEQDPTGRAALETALGADLPEIEAEFAAWLAEVPMVAENPRDLDVTLGASVAPGSGDGPHVTSIASGTRSTSNLRVGSVITHVDGRPTRDVRDLARVLDSYEPGSTVTITARRGKKIEQIESTVIAND